jgi:hypothetical protein
MATSDSEWIKRVLQVRQRELVLLPACHSTVSVRWLWLLWDFKLSYTAQRNRVNVKWMWSKMALCLPKNPFPSFGIIPSSIRGMVHSGHIWPRGVRSTDRGRRTLPWQSRAGDFRGTACYRHRVYHNTNQILLMNSATKIHPILIRSQKNLYLRLAN